VSIVQAMASFGLVPFRTKWNRRVPTRTPSFRVWLDYRSLLLFKARETAQAEPIRHASATRHPVCKSVATDHAIFGG
jgi:hypothetical protein